MVYAVKGGRAYVTLTSIASTISPCDIETSGLLYSQGSPSTTYAGAVTAKSTDFDSRDYYPHWQISKSGSVYFEQPFPGYTDGDFSCVLASPFNEDLVKVAVDIPEDADLGSYSLNYADLDSVGIFELDASCFEDNATKYYWKAPVYRELFTVVCMLATLYYYSVNEEDGVRYYFITSVEGGTPEYDFTWTGATPTAYEGSGDPPPSNQSRAELFIPYTEEGGMYVGCSVTDSEGCSASTALVLVGLGEELYSGYSYWCVKPTEAESTVCLASPNSFGDDELTDAINALTLARLQNIFYEVSGGPYLSSDECSAECSGCNCENYCPPGYYYDVITESCRPLSDVDPDGETVPPATPTTPVITSDCDPLSVSIASGAFPATTVVIKLERSSDNGATWNQVHVYSSAGSWADTSITGGKNYKYRSHACNVAGCSAYTAIATATLVGAVVPVWVSPAPNTTAAGKVTLIATAGPRSGLYATNPVTMKIWGGDLDVIYNAAGNQWIAYLDSEVEYQGITNVELVARDVNGCYSSPVLLPIYINYSIERNSRWSEKNIAVDVTSGLDNLNMEITHVGYYNSLYQKGAEEKKRWFRWWLISPDPGAATLMQYANNAFMLNKVKDAQDILPNQIIALNVPSSSARLVMQSSATEAMTLYNLNSTAALKVRQFEDGSAEILTSAGYYKWTDEGIETVADFADYEFGDVEIVDNVIDAALVGTKIYLVRTASPTKFVIIDLLQGKISTDGTRPINESRLIKAIENFNGKPVIIYSDSISAKAYTYENGSVDDIFTLTEGVRGAWSHYDRFFVGSGTGVLDTTNLFEVSSLGALTLLGTNDHPITAARFFATEAESIVNFGDDEGNAYTINGEGKSQLAGDIDGSIIGLSMFKGSSIEANGVISLSNGGDASYLFMESGGIYTPQWQLKDGENVEADSTAGLARVITTIRLANGDPLLGGDAGAYSESLIAAFNTENGAFLARIQEADVDKTLCVKAIGIMDQNFKRERTREIPEEA